MLRSLVGSEMCIRDSGDGDPANDVDLEGRWVQVIYDTEGKKNVKLTVYDESERNSVYMVVDVAKSPFDIKTSFEENSASILLIVLVCGAGLVLAQRYRENKELESENKKEVVSIDQLFDGTDEKITEQKQIKNEIEEGFENSTSRPSRDIDFDDSEENKIAINNILSEEDIEALFEE